MKRTIHLSLVGALSVSALGGFVGRAHSAPAVSASPALSPSASRPAAQKAEPAITIPGAVGDYVRAVHSRLHARWTQDFVQTVSATHPADHPLNVLSHQVTLAMTIRWDGTVAERSVKKSSGSPEFDRAAMDIARKSAPYPLPSVDVISDDSFAHLEWTFARDHRACAAGAQLTRVDDPLEVSLPRLIVNNRIAEALRRISQSGAGANGAGLDRFARLYLGRTVPDPVQDVAASFALAEAGDRTQVPRLRAALASAPTADLAARGLQKLGVDICETVRETISGGSAAARSIAMGAVRSVAKSGGDIGACRTSLTGTLTDSQQPTASRLLALDTLIAFMPAAAVRPIVMATIEDKDPAVRGVALLASVRKGAGRPEMYRLAPLLRDKAVEVRGAASAGMVRAGGDTALDQLYLLARETDPRPGTWVAAELAHMSTRSSAEFLGKMLKKSNLPVQVAAAHALAGRKDAPARSELDAAKTDDRIPKEVRAIAVGDVKATGPALATKAASSTGAGDAAAAPAAATEPLRQLLKSNRNREASAWILDRFTSLEPRDGIDALGAWLLRQPAAATAGETPAAPSPPQTAAPAAVNPVGPGLPEAPPATPPTTANALGL
ncbi:MAG: TonB family protein [Deltaproteobacteria bacterium]|nr:TonB family protein [Deltaproteobacteria bacterium]